MHMVLKLRNFLLPQGYALSLVVPAIHLALGVQNPTPIVLLEPRQQRGSHPIYLQRSKRKIVLEMPMIFESATLQWWSIYFCVPCIFISSLSRPISLIVEMYTLKALGL